MRWYILPKHIAFLNKIGTLFLRKKGRIDIEVYKALVQACWIELKSTGQHNL